jgi:hypothetical protein
MSSEKNTLRIRRSLLGLSVILILILTMSTFVQQVKGYTLFVDNSVDAQSPTSDVDSGGDLGTASALSGAQTLDDVDQTLTEEDTGGVGVDEYLVPDNNEAGIGGWDASVGTSPWIDIQDEPTNYIWTDANNAWTDWFSFGSTSGSGSGFTVNMSVYHESDADSYYNWEIDTTGDGTAEHSGTGSNQATYAWDELGTISGLDTATEINAARVRLQYNKGGGASDDLRVDAVRLGVTQSSGANYKLDWEHQIQDLDLGKDRYNATFYGFASGGDSETFSVFIWNSSWYDTGLDIGTTEQWYNVTISGAGIVSSTTFRFVGNDDISGDTTQSVLNLDYSGIRGWNFTVDIINATFTITGVGSQAGQYSVGTSYSLGSLLLVNVSSGNIYDIQIKGTDVLKTPIASGYIYWDNDIDPSGSTALTASYVNWKTSQSVGDQVQHSIYLFIIIPWTPGDPLFTQEAWTFTFDVQILTS